MSVSGEYEPFGSATLVSGAVAVLVSNKAITPSSLVFLQLQSEDATAVRVVPINIPGVGFTISANAAATATTNVFWWIAKY